MTTLLPLLTDEEIRSHFISWGLDSPDSGVTTVVVHGAWNAGKSSLVNALTDTQDLLPTGPTPDTAVITVVSHSPTLRMSVDIDGREYPITSHSDLKRSVRKGARSQLVRVGHPAMPWRDALLVDLPGIESPIDEHLLVNSDFLPRADAVLYVMLSEFAPRATDVEALRSLMTRVSAERIRVVITRTAHLDTRALHDLEEHLHAVLPPGLDDVFFVDSNSHFEPSERPSGIVRLRDSISALLQGGADLRRAARQARVASLAAAQRAVCGHEIQALTTAALSAKDASEVRLLRLRTAMQSLEAFTRSLEAIVSAESRTQTVKLSDRLYQLQQNAIHLATEVDISSEESLNAFATRLSTDYTRALMEGFIDTRSAIAECLGIAIESRSDADFGVEIDVPGASEPIHLEQILDSLVQKASELEKLPLPMESLPIDVEDLLKGMRQRRQQLASHPLMLLLQELLNLRGKLNARETLQNEVVKRTHVVNQQVKQTFEQWWKESTDGVLGEISARLTSGIQAEIRTLEDSKGADEADIRQRLQDKQCQLDQLVNYT